MLPLAEFPKSNAIGSGPSPGACSRRLRRAAVAEERSARAVQMDRRWHGASSVGQELTDYIWKNNLARCLMFSRGICAGQVNRYWTDIELETSGYIASDKLGLRGMYKYLVSNHAWFGALGGTVQELPWYLIPNLDQLFAHRARC